MKLEIKHLAPYLPYGLKILDIYKERDYIKEITGVYSFENIFTDDGDITFECIKPILRPMSGFPLYFEYLFETTDDQNIKDFLDEDFLYDKGIYSWEELVFAEPNYIPYGTLQVLLKYHFDVFELIPAGIAVSIHDIGKVVA